jgi:hypothetical protein
VRVSSRPPSQRRTAVERTLAVLVVALVLGVGGGIWLAGGGDGTDRPDVATLAAAIDWSQPEELPAPVREDFRSEFVSGERGYRFWPRSGRITPSLAYRFDTGHCGLTFLADFDGSFWRPIAPGAGRPPGFFDEDDVGAMALVDFNTAVYRSSDGIEVALERIAGPVVTQPCV